MNDFEKNVSFALTEELLSESRHICLIYDNEEERRKIVAEYMATGLRKGEQVRYFTDVASSEEVRSWLLEVGVELPEAEKSGAFGVSNAADAYCPTGQFEPGKMIAGSVHRYEIAAKAGYKGVRSCGEMTWALKGIPGSDRILEYETLLNTVDSTFPHTGMCQYDSRIFDGATLFKVLQVHPYMIARGQVVRNPFYVRPEEFRAELTRRK